MKSPMGSKQALEELKPEVPFVIRLVGTNDIQGRQILAEANLITAESLQEAAEKAVNLAKEVA